MKNNYRQNKIFFPTIFLLYNNPINHGGKFIRTLLISPSKDIVCPFGYSFVSFVLFDLPELRKSPLQTEHSGHYQWRFFPSLSFLRSDYFFPRHGPNKFLSMRGRVEYRACAETGARTSIGASGNFII